MRGPFFQFGYSVAISGDTIVAGCNSCTIAGQAGRGAIFVFTRTGTIWTESPDSPLSIGAGGDNFGQSVAIDGDTIVVGAPNSDVPGKLNQGSAHIFVRSGTTWTYDELLLAPDGLAQDFFGKSVAIRGNRVVVGAPGDDGATNATGSLYVFDRSGATWSLHPGMPLAVAAPDAGNGDGLGSSVALSPSGTLLLSGAPGADHSPDSPVGAAYLWRHDGAGWAQVRKFVPFGPNQGEDCGRSVALNDETVLIGAPNEDLPGIDSGTVYQFDRTDTTTWTAVPPQYAPADSQTGHGFGRAVALSKNTAVVGAWFHDVPPYTDMGAAYVYVGLPGSASDFDPPTLAYMPLPGVPIPVSASAGGLTPSATITVEPQGGSGAATRSISCSVPAPYSVAVQGSPFASGGASGTIRIACDTSNPPDQVLTCVESPGSLSRTWPLDCNSAAVYSSDPRPSSAVAAYGTVADSDGIAEASLKIVNDGTATLDITDCQSNPAVEFGGIDLNATIPVGGMGSLTFSCIVPPAGTRLAGSLSCDTSDPNRPQVLYKLFCVAPPDAVDGASSSPVDRIVSESPDANALVGSSAAIALDAAGNEILVVGAPVGGADNDGRVYLHLRPAGSQSRDPVPSAKTGSAGRPDRVLRMPASFRGKRASGALGNKFGQAVAASPDGTRIAVGATSANGTGLVLEFEQPPGGWTSDVSELTPVEVLAPPADASINPVGFGSAVVYGPDGSLAVSAPESAVSGEGSVGAVYLYNAARQPGPPIVPDAPLAGAEFGRALGYAHGLLAVGAPGEHSATGAAYVYEANANLVGPANRVVPAATTAGDKFGASIAVTYDLVAVGSPFTDTATGAQSGAATILRRGSGNALDAATRLIPTAPGTRGAGAALATNGELLVLGAPFTQVGTQTNRGRAIVFDLDDAVRGSSRPLGTYENAIGDQDDQFATALALSRVRLVVGVPHGDEGAEAQEGRADPFVLDRISRLGFDR